MAVNVVGSILLGATGAAVATGAPGGLAPLVGTGFCGAFTTYSSFAVEMRALAADGDWRTLAGFALGTLAAALVGAAAGGWSAGSGREPPAAGRLIPPDPLSRAWW